MDMDMEIDMDMGMRMDGWMDDMITLSTVISSCLSQCYYQIKKCITLKGVFSLLVFNDHPSSGVRQITHCSK